MGMFPREGGGGSGGGGAGGAGGAGGLGGGAMGGGDRPKLVEPGTKYFLSETLKQCHQFKLRHHNIMMNVLLAGILVFMMASFLWYKYRGKPTPEEERLRERQKREYILSKIQNYQESKRQLSDRLITGLPGWQTPIDMMNDAPSYS